MVVCNARPQTRVATVCRYNRATGYIGTASTSVVDVSERSINISLPDIRLFPPNLQVQVDRQYQVEKGLTAGESRHYRVGSEGAALTSDQFVSIHTQWLNHDGTALPSELPGYPGRLANLVGEGELNSSTANHFSIDPGKHTEVLQLPNPALSSTAAHQYLHVVGREKHAMPESPDFGAGDDSELPSRPTRFVPVKVAIYDEEASAELQKTEEALELEGVKQDSSVYHWVYRAEMQYSVFELDVNQTLAIDEQGVEQELPDLVTTIPGEAEQLALEAYLSSGPYDRLPSIDVFGELTLEQGGNQQLLNPAEQPQRIEIADFGNLDANDYLSINLINSEDASNVLSEWVFQTLTMFPGPNAEPIELSADDTQERLFTAVLRGLSPNNDSGVDWIVEGENDITNQRSISDDPLFITSVDISPIAGTEFSLAVKTLDELSAPSSSINYCSATINSTIRSTIGLGSISHPNRSPLLALDGSVLRRFGFQDDTGLIDITATGVTRVSNSPQAGTHSYSFDPDQSSRLSTTLSPSSKAQMGQLWVYPRAGGGSLARIGSSLNLTLQSNRQITLAVSILTDGEIQQVQVNSDPIEMNQWHFVAYHLEDDRLTLVVDGQSSETALTLDAAYQSHTAELEFGRGYDGLMSAMRWYSMDSAPLLTFADGREQVEIELTGAATRELNVLSTDSLNIGTSGTLAAHTVALTVDDQVIGSLIQVVAADEVARASGVLIDTIAPSLDWNAFKSLYRQSGAKSARALYRRVIAQSVDTSLPGYSELNAVTALLSVLNGLPEHGDLNASLGTILAFYTDHENNPTLRSATARYLYSAIEPMLVNEKVRLDRLAVPLTVLAEMLDVSPIAGFRLASSIKSEADFNTWMQFFSLPADGWTGVLPPVPSMGLACDDTQIPVVEGSVTELDMPLLACRATGRQAADLVDILWGVSSIVEEDPQIVVATMQELLDALPVADLFVRKALFPNTDQDVGSGLKWLPINNANAAAPVVAAVVARVAIRVGIWGGRAAGVYVVGRAIRSEVKQQLNNFLRGRHSRIHPLVLMGATSYL